MTAPDVVEARRTLGLDSGALLGTVQELPAGRRLITEGRATSRFVVVLNGSLVVMVAGQEVDRLVQGDWCGEIGLLSRLDTNDGRATASFMTRTPVRLLSFAPWEFKALLDLSPNAEVLLRARALDRLARASAISAVNYRAS